MLKSITDVVKSKLCISCGMCAAVSPSGCVKMKESHSSGLILPEIPISLDNTWTNYALDLCPGKGYPIIALAKKLFPDAPHSDPDLGAWHMAVAARCTDDRFLNNAASGGVMTGIAAHLLETGRIQGVVATKMSYGKPGPRTETFLARTVDDLLASQGSKYCPVPALEVLRRLLDLGNPVAFIGTPCQIAGIRMGQHMQSLPQDGIAFTIGNFCGGFRDLRETDTLIRRSGMHPEDVVSFRYRGGGQPGSMRIEDRKGKVVVLPYPEYVNRTGYVKLKRCRLCVDATAELADIACGDAWIPRFLESGKAWSLLLVRSTSAYIIIQEMISQGKLEISDVSVNEIKISQYHNLLSKKSRQAARRRLHRLLLSTVPEFDGGYPKNKGGLWLEMKVLLRHMIFSLAEKLHVFPLFAKLLKRY